MSKTIAVTGVASGIGAAIAEQLQAKGHRVIGFDIHEAPHTVDRFIPLDLNAPEAIEAAARAVDEPLDGLCNNAGLPPRDGMEAIILQVNFLGQRQFTTAMVRHLKPGSSIVNMASRAGSHWRDNLEQNKRLAALQTPDLAEFVKAETLDPTRSYNLSKEAMILWTQAMTEDLIAKKLRANSVSPGAVATGILDDFARAFGDRMAKNVARAGRAASPAEVAAVACFLLSEESAWLKGVDVPVDGGMGAFNLSDRLELGVFAEGGS